MTKSYTLLELSQHLQCSYQGDANKKIEGVNTLEEASENEASFLANPRYIDLLSTTKAGLICIGKNTTYPENKNYLISDNPTSCFQKLVELFMPRISFTGFTKIHPTAVIHPTATIEDHVSIGPYAVVDENAHIEQGSQILSHVYVGPNVKIGKNCIIHPSVVIREHCIIKDRVILQPGCVIGSCGFGYTPNAQGHLEKLEQVGNVIIEEDVEIGANTTIDRARFKSTIIQKGTKIDNLVQIAHNVQIGKHTVIAAQVGIAGSSKIGSHVMLGGQVGIVGHIEIGDQVMVAAKSGISKNHLEPGKLGGNPAMELNQYHRQCVHIRNLENTNKTLKELQKKIEALQKDSLIEELPASQE
jgi:UDP-3-O-[3-hydroxymyristoyl] glucosamine N-acyltransferase